MEGKKKFEKPQMEVVQLKPAGIICVSCLALCGPMCGAVCSGDDD